MIGQTIGDYILTQHLGHGELESYWAGRHATLDITVRVRMLKAAYLRDPGIRQRYIAVMREDASRQNLQEGVHYQLIQTPDLLGMVIVTDRVEQANPEAIVASLENAAEGIYTRKGTAPAPVVASPRRPPPTDVEMEEYHRKMQLFAKIAFVVGVIFGVGVTGAAAGLFWWADISLTLEIVGIVIGASFAIGAMGAVGLLERRKWGNIFLQVSHISMMTISLFVGIGAVESVEENTWGFSPTNLFLLGAISLSWCAYSIWGLVLLYSPKAEYYYRGL
jgi:hypothetical protein